MSAEFTARFPADCPAGDEIEPGEPVRYDEADDLWHTACLRQEASKPPAKEPEVCDRCWLFKPCEHDDGLLP